MGYIVIIKHHESIYLFYFNFWYSIFLHYKRSFWWHNKYWGYTEKIPTEEVKEEEAPIAEEVATEEVVEEKLENSEHNEVNKFIAGFRRETRLVQQIAQTHASKFSLVKVLSTTSAASRGLGIARRNVMTSGDQETSTHRFMACCC